MQLPIIIEGSVVEGKKRGKELGFPTANLDYNRTSDLESGVYAGFTMVNTILYKAAISIGKASTFQDEDFTVEAYLIDFTEDLYGQRLRLEVTHKLREMLKFDSVEALIDQIKNDVLDTIKLVDLENL